MTFPQYTDVCPEGVFEKKFKMSALCGKVRPGDLAREMEKITEEHLGVYGMSRGELKAENKIWVIGWTAIHINRLPEQGEQVILRIWPGKMKAVMHTRRYAFYSFDGEPLACAASLFLLMDSETRGVAEPTEKLQAVPVVVIPDEPKLPKMTVPFPEELSQQVVRTVAAEEIDLNGHLNNTHYLDWACALAEPDRAPQFVWVQYAKELMEGQNVVLNYEKQDDSLYLTGLAEGEESFKLLMSYSAN